MATSSSIELESASVLSFRDVQELIKDPSPESKSRIIQKVSKQYNPHHFTEKELALAEQIFRLLMVDAVVKVRQALAESLRENPHIPHDIIMKLAQDVQAVATPILSMSTVLTDDDIIAILGHRQELWCYLSVSARPAISEKLSDAISRSDSQQVLEALLDNPGAEIGEATLTNILDQGKATDSVIEKIAKRDELPLNVVEKLIAVATDEVAKQLSSKYLIDEEQVEAEARQAREKNTLELIAIRGSRAQTEMLVNQLFDEERLTASLIINALCHGNTDFFEISLAKLAGIPTENAHVLIGDRGKLGLRAIYNKSGLPLTMFKAVRMLLQSVRDAVGKGFRPGTTVFANTVISNMLIMAEGEEVENLSYILALLRQHTLRSVA